jgi:hypothetical protein
MSAILLKKLDAKRFFLFLACFLLISLYVFYVAFVITKNQGPVDYETFMQIGRRFLAGEKVYGVNSYYPMPYVLIFAAFASLPKWLSLFLWLSLPVIAAVVICEGSIWALAFAPTFAHFVGGQSALPAMIGLWGYQRVSSKFTGGLCLALTTLKPQLGLFPVAWAVFQWIKEWRVLKRFPSSLFGFLVGVGSLYIPSFILYPTWPLDWLQSPRPLFERAMSGFVPRTLLLLKLSPYLYAVLLISISLLTFLLLYKRFSIDRFIIWSFVISPFVHDYDLIQIIPLIKSTRQKILAVLLSLPTWVVIFTAYANDTAWHVVTLVGLGLLFFYVWIDQSQGSVRPA